jgi:hypothetical protein
MIRRIYFYNANIHLPGGVTKFCSGVVTYRGFFRPGAEVFHAAINDASNYFGVSIATVEMITLTRLK